MTNSVFESSISAIVSRVWPERLLAHIIPLKGDASARRFWRVMLAGAGQGPASAIAIDLGADDLPLYARALKLVPHPLSEPLWLNVHRFLTRIGAAVPEIHALDLEARMLLVEDVGSTPLFEAALRGHAGDLYRLAVDELLIFHISGTEKLNADCIAAEIAYDQRLFYWELEQFLEAGLGQIAPAADREAVAAELKELALRLDRFPRVFSHRDFHGHNLFVQYRGRGQPLIRVIDFQDALMAPAAQDLAVLLTTRDAARVITPQIERRIVDYYYAALTRRNAARLQFEEFYDTYRWCVLQHALKVVGRFLTLEREGKSGYREFIPFALEQARRMLKPGEFPKLREALAL